MIQEIDIPLTGDLLTINGEHKEKQEIKEEYYSHKKYRYGPFSCSIQIPVTVKHYKADAVFEDGILALALPKVEEVNPEQTKAKAKVMTKGGRKTKEQ